MKLLNLGFVLLMSASPMIGNAAEFSHIKAKCWAENGSSNRSNEYHLEDFYVDADFTPDEYQYFSAKSSILPMSQLTPSKPEMRIAVYIGYFSEAREPYLTLEAVFFKNGKAQMGSASVLNPKVGSSLNTTYDGDCDATFTPDGKVKLIENCAESFSASCKIVELL